MTNVVSRTHYSHSHTLPLPLSSPAAPIWKMYQYCSTYQVGWSSFLSRKSSQAEVVDLEAMKGEFMVLHLVCDLFATRDLSLINLLKYEICSKWMVLSDLNVLLPFIFLTIAGLLGLGWFKSDIIKFNIRFFEIPWFLIFIGRPQSIREYAVICRSEPAKRGEWLGVTVCKLVFIKMSEDVTSHNYTNLALSNYCWEGWRVEGRFSRNLILKWWTWPHSDPYR